MSIANVRPSNLANIKRLANQLKKRDGIPHRRALDLPREARALNDTNMPALP